MRDNFFGFSNSSSDGRPVGVVIDGDTSTGIYNVVLSLWSEFSGRKIIVSTSAPSIGEWGHGDIWYQREM